MKVLLTAVVVITLVFSSLTSVYAERGESKSKGKNVKQSSILQQQQLLKQQLQKQQQLLKQQLQKQQQLQQQQLKQQELQQQQLQKSKIQNINSSESTFSDVGKDFWAYQAITNLVNRGIIKGYSDKTFKPNEKVTRTQFAIMLTRALNLKATDNAQKFVDVAPTSWYYNEVEASENYLTGYQTSNGTLYFYGDKDAVREDMAVALVKALNLILVSDNGQLQQVFTDYNEISAKLKDYINTAYIDGIMMDQMESLLLKAH